MTTIFHANNQNMEGTRTNHTKFCTHCGAPLLGGSRFCTKCGTPVYNPAPAPVSTPVQPQKKSRSLLVGICGGAAVFLILILILVFALRGGGNTLKGDGYVVELPESADDIECEFVTDEQMEELQSYDYQFISKPIMMTQDGGQHVQLDKMAKVSFDIPKDIPEEEYINLVGVLFTDDGPMYMIPDIEGIRRGVVQFETSHFSPVGAAKMDNEKRKELFVDRICVSEWKANACDMDLEKTLKEKIKDFTSDIGFGEDALLGMVAREVLSDNEFINDASDLIDAYDSNNSAEFIVGRLKEKARAKMLAVLFEKLKGDKEVDKVEYDELKDKYVHTRVTKDGKNKKIVEKLEKHLTQENMEELGKRLGQGDSPMTIAWDYVKKYAKGFAEDQLKDFSTKMVPQIKLMQEGAKYMKILKKFWASNEMIDMYNTYAKNANSDGRMSNDDWNALFVRRLNAAMSKFGMTEEQIRKQFEERYANNQDIERRKYELRKLIDLWESPEFELVKQPIFDKLGFDYIQRLTRIHVLMERFRKELVVNGDIPGRERQNSIDYTLCLIVEKYLEFYPDQEKFYRWLAKKGFYKSKLKKNVDGLDNLRSWWLIRTEVNRTPNATKDEGSTVYSSSAGHHKKVERWTGKKFLSDFDEGYWYLPHTSTFTATIEAPPACIAGGDSLVLHTTLNLDAKPNGWYLGESSSLNFDLEGVGMGAIHVSARRGQVRNLVGSTSVCTRYGSPHSGEWDFVIYIPNGSKDQLKALNFSSCGSRTHWVYKWASVFEKDE